MKTSKPMSQEEIRRMLRSIGYSVRKLHTNGRHFGSFTVTLNGVPMTDHGSSDLAWKAAERHWERYNT